MKRMMILLVMALVMFTSSAFAATTADLTVSATVQATCAITGGTLDFGIIDTFGLAADVTQNSTGVTVNCTNGTDYVVTDTVGPNYEMTGAADPINNLLPFELNYPAFAQADGTDQTITFGGIVRMGAALAAPADNYSATVVLTVAP